MKQIFVLLDNDLHPMTVQEVAALYEDDLDKLGYCLGRADQSAFDEMIEKTTEAAMPLWKALKYFLSISKADVVID